MDRSQANAAATNLSRSAVMATASGGVVLLALSSACAVLTRFDTSFVAGSIAIYLPAALIVNARIRKYHPHEEFGSANIITLGRLVLASLIAGLSLELAFSKVTITPIVAWCFLTMTVIGLILDAIDGPVARREGLTSRFGSRFDMEVDALLILVLSVAVYFLDKAGWWVLIGGLLRYAFVAAAYIWPQLASDLPPAWRRKIISAVQGGVLAALLAPIIVPPLSTITAAIALGLLLYSFAVDVVWLVRRKRALL
jgi:phosphatidylglycerophosphate synthase